MNSLIRMTERFTARLSGKAVVTVPTMIITIVTMLSFQNCGKVGFSDLSSAAPQLKNSEGGDGIDGKVYRSYSKCPDSSYGVGYRMRISADKQTAALLRENCEDLKTPKAVDVSQIHFSSISIVGLPSAISYLGRAYDEEVNGGVAGNSVLTTPVCWGKSQAGVDFDFGAVEDLQSGVVTGQLIHGGVNYGGLKLYYSDADHLYLLPTTGAPAYTPSPTPGGGVTALSVYAPINGTTGTPPSSTNPGSTMEFMIAGTGAAPISVAQPVQCGTQEFLQHNKMAFTYIGNQIQTFPPTNFTWPKGKTSLLLTIKVWGAGGGGGNGSGVRYPGGAGAFVLAQRRLQPSETLYLLVGQGGGAGNLLATSGLTDPAYGGGGRGVRNIINLGLAMPLMGPGGGGGFSGVFSNASYDAGNALIIAAGGGGGGISSSTTQNFSGDNGGAPESNATPPSLGCDVLGAQPLNIPNGNCLNGQGARGASAGAAAAYLGGIQNPEGAGKRLAGGIGFIDFTGARVGGAGGGGGLWGGGGGTQYFDVSGMNFGGGGGGSSFAASANLIMAKFTGGANLKAAADNDPEYAQAKSLGAGGAGGGPSQPGGNGYVVISW